MKKGQKVVCIKPDNFGLLEKNKDYTIRLVKEDGAVTVSEVDSSRVKNGYFNGWRFRLIETDWVNELIEKLEPYESVNVA